MSGSMARCDPWIVRFRQSAPTPAFSAPTLGEVVRVLTLPHAGRGASLFRDWPLKLPRQTEVWAVQLPGREQRLSETRAVACDELVTPLVDVLKRELRDGRYVIYGHSMGAILGFELARALVSAGAPEPLHLFLAARRAPHCPGTDRVLHTIADRDEFLAALQDRFGPLDEELLANPRMLDAFLPTLRADLQLVETWQYEPVSLRPHDADGGRDDGSGDALSGANAEGADPRGSGLSCPLTVLRGTQDRDSATDCAGWQEYTSGPFRQIDLPEGHFFVDQAADFVAATLRRQLRLT